MFALLEIEPLLFKNGSRFAEGAIQYVAAFVRIGLLQDVIDEAYCNP